jgi:hypothetical protein
LASLTTTGSDPSSAGSANSLTPGTLLAGDAGSQTYSLAPTILGGGATVPEPSSLILAALAVGLGSPLAFGRRRRS